MNKLLLAAVALASPILPDPSKEYDDTVLVRKEV